MSEPGRLFGGRYEVTGPLASGGMAEVFIARDRLLGRPVALQILHPEFARDRAFIERFRREAQSAASLNDPRIVSIYDWGSDGGTYYLVMEFVEGKSLKDLIQSEGPFTTERAEEIAADVCSALHFAHRHGIVHRGVKPANIMVNSEGTTKVMDFGIARAITDSGATVTQTGTVLGTANYLSPEQAQGMPVDARSDVYSVGVVLYEMLTGQVPFKADTAVAIAYKHVREAPKPPSLLNPDITPALDAVVLKALSKNPDNRYQSADEMRLDLQRLLAGQAVEATPVLPADQTVAMNPTGPPREATTVLPPVRAARDVPPRRGVALALVLIMIAAILVGAGALVYAVVSGGAKSVVVPDVRGLPLGTAQTTLSQNKLRGVQDSTTFSDTVPQGSVVSQSVQDGTKVRPSSTVLLTVSSGAQKGPIPDVSNKSLADAQAALKAAGFTPGTVTNEFSKTVPQGQVTRTDPPAGTQATKAAPVTLFVSAGQQTRPLTDVTGLDQAQATKILKDEAFNPVVTNTCDRSAKPGTVLSQSPQGGQPAPQNSDVAITVNQAQPVPNVVGMSQSQAASTIQQAGFTPQVQTQNQLLPAGAGNVSSQSPAAGQTACPGDTVTITVPQTLGGTPTPTPTPSP
ncbi:MAG TPA: Stk1 family PASTA domain-containing Ser/Thr kinase [Actinomycetota bacterium]|nr:Stk1 family PASTA domain-containing Ser/Thr kinase [Actinomycetota bacterium]